MRIYIQRQGGLRIPTLRLTIPFMKKAILRRLVALWDPVFVALVMSSHTFMEEMRMCSDPPIRVGDMVVTSAPAPREALAEQLHGSADGYRLCISVPYVHSWVTDDTAKSVIDHGSLELNGMTLSWRSFSSFWRSVAGQSCALRLFRME